MGVVHFKVSVYIAMSADAIFSPPHSPLKLTY